ASRRCRVPLSLSSCFCFLLLRPPPSPTLFPYTTLFRSFARLRRPRPGTGEVPGPIRQRPGRGVRILPCHRRRDRRARVRVQAARSEEHTSELQSRENLVCRLLLEKKKKRKTRCVRPLPR